MKNKAIGFLILIVFVLILSGCNGTKYGAVMDSNARDWISEEFLKENRVRGAFYLNEDYIEDEDGSSDEYIYDEESPSFRTFIIREEEEFKRIFSKYEGVINFEKKMVLLYIFPDTSSRDFYIKKMNYENQVLTVQIKKHRRWDNRVDSDLPTPRCIMIEMKKLEIDTVNFIKG